jgi:hypothetical protein
MPFDLSLVVLFVCLLGAIGTSMRIIWLLKQAEEEDEREAGEAEAYERIKENPFLIGADGKPFPYYPADPDEVIHYGDNDYR